MSPNPYNNHILYMYVYYRVDHFIIADHLPYLKNDWKPSEQVRGANAFNHHIINYIRLDLC